MVRDIHVDRVFTTSGFDTNYRKLVREHKTEVIEELNKVIELLVNLQDTIKYRPRMLNSIGRGWIYIIDLNESTSLLYRYEGGRSIHLDLVAKGAEIATENIASTIKLEGNNVSSEIPDKIDSFLQDIAQVTNIISYSDIIKFGKKLSQSEQYRKYALGGIEHLLDRWGEAALYEDELMMDDIAYDVKSYMTFPIQKKVTKEIASESIAHIESLRLNNVVFSVMFDGDSVSIKSRHPYDEAKYHYAISNDGGHNFKIYKDYEFVEDFVTKSFDRDEESGIKNFNWRELARELLRLDKNVESRMMHN